jgi:hypothetical protein
LVCWQASSEAAWAVELHGDNLTKTDKVKGVDYA